METNKTLSDKKIGAGETFHIEKPHIRDIWHYEEEDVKEFIKKLKEEINLKLGEPDDDGACWGDNTDDFFNLIDKLAGEDLI